MSTRPNFLFIMTDQHNPKVAGFAGDEVIDTPALDRLAAEGTVFENAYCQQPLCVPSRAAILTGKYCRNIGIYGNMDILPANSETFPRVLGRIGYSTCLVGKAHLNGDQFQGYQQRPYGDLFGQAHQPDPRRLPENYDHGLGDIPFQAGPSRIPLRLTQTEITTAEATKFLQAHVARHPDQPFLLSVHYDKPHFPINPPERLFRKYESAVALSEHWYGEHGDDHLARLTPFVRENFTDEGYYHVDAEHHRRALAAYYGCVEWIDENIGQLLDVLDYLGLAENTVVIYTADHGEMASAHGAWQKMVFYEESARVPLVIRRPNFREHPGSTTRHGSPPRRGEPVGLIDLFPTICELAGAEAGGSAPADLDGESLVPLLDGSVPRAFSRTDIFSESVLINKPNHAGCMVRRDRWKYVLYLDDVEELYDLESDPGETRNLAAARPDEADTADAAREIRDELRRAVEEFWEPAKQRARYDRTPRMPREKHFYEFSNQFILGDGSVVDARP